MAFVSEEVRFKELLQYYPDKTAVDSLIFEKMKRSAEKGSNQKNNVPPFMSSENRFSGLKNEEQQQWTKKPMSLRKEHEIIEYTKATSGFISDTRRFPSSKTVAPGPGNYKIRGFSDEIILNNI